MTIPYVTLQDTFETWRTTTNQLITLSANNLVLAQSAYDYSNSAVRTAANITTSILTDNAIFRVMVTDASNVLAESVASNVAYNTAVNNVTSYVNQTAANINANLVYSTTSANAYAGIMSNTSNTWANTQGGISNTWANLQGGISNTWANTQGGISNTWSNTQGGISNTWANTQGGISNTWANLQGGISNTWANDVGTAANSYAGAMANSGNVWSNTQGGISNTWANTVAGRANTWANTQGGISNTWANTVGGVSNTWANTVGGVSNTWANTVGGVSNTWANAIGTAANAYAGSMVNVAFKQANTSQVALAIETASSSTFYPLFTSVTSGGFVNTANVDNVTLTYIPLTGTLSATHFNSLSDLSLKTNVQIIGDAVDTVSQLSGVSFNWKNTGNKSYGVIAQDLEKIIPELIGEINNNKTVNYDGIIAFLIESVKELNTRVRELEKKQ